MFFDKVITEKEIRFTINRKAVYSLLGYRKGKTALTEKIINLIDEAYEKASELIVPQGIYVIRRIKEKGDEIKFANSKIVLKGKSMQVLLEESLATIFFGVTIGPGIEEKISQETEKKNIDKALVFDTLGSEAVEAAANFLNNHLIAQARQAKKFLTTRFSPGYGDLALDFQKEIYEELSLHDLEVEINDKSILYPQKTITGIIGVEE